MRYMKESNDILPLPTDKEMLHDQLAFAQNKIDEALIVAFNLIEENPPVIDPHRENVKNVRDKLVVLYRDSPFSLTPILKKLEPEDEKEVKKMTRGSAKKWARAEEVVVITEDNYAQLETSVLGSFEVLSAEQKDRLIRSLVTSY